MDGHVNEPLNHTDGHINEPLNHTGGHVNGPLNHTKIQVLKRNRLLPRKLTDLEREDTKNHHASKHSALGLLLTVAEFLR